MLELFPVFWMLGASTSASSNLDFDSPIFAIEPEEREPSYHAVVNVTRNTGEYVL